MKWLAFVFVLLAPTSCASGPPKLHVRTGAAVHACHFPITVVLAQGFPRDAGFLVKHGFEYWNLLSQSRVFVFVGESSFNQRMRWDPGWVMVIINEYLPKHVHAQAHFTADAAGCVYPEYLEINSTLLQRPAELETMVRHEAGHFLGLADTSDPASLMYGSLMGRTVEHPVPAGPRERTFAKGLGK
jgi:hypothetical protein